MYACLHNAAHCYIAFCYLLKRRKNKKGVRPSFYLYLTYKLTFIYTYNSYLLIYLNCVTLIFYFFLLKINSSHDPVSLSCYPLRSHQPHRWKTLPQVSVFGTGTDQNQQQQCIRNFNTTYVAADELLFSFYSFHLQLTYF